MTDLSSKPPGGFAMSAAIIGGLAAGAVDIGAASLITGHDPVFILHTIAGGLLGKAAFAGGWKTAALGLALQEAMGVAIALIYGLAARLVPVLARVWIVGGLVYGAAIFFVMNDVVVPLSAWKVTPHFTVQSFAENMLAMLVFGLIVAFASRRGSK